MESHAVADPLARLPPLALSMAEAEVLSRLSRTSLYKLIAAGELPAIRRGRARFILRADLDALLQRQKVTQ